MIRQFSQSINFPIVLRVMGWLLSIEALFMLIPACVSWGYGESITSMSFLYSAGITIAVGLALMCLQPGSMQLRRREGLLLTATVWIFFSAFGMLPFLFSGTLPQPSDAFFETMSGFTTTGATVITDVDRVPHGILLWRSLIQWIGGMGIILFTLAVLPMLNHKGGIAMFNAEVTGITHERMRPRVSQTAKYLWSLYIGFTLVLWALLTLGPMGWFDSLCHTMATVSTGGFSSKTMGLGYWHDAYSDTVIMLFMFLCGVNFALMFKASKQGPKVLWASDTFRWYAGITLGVTLIIVVRMMAEGFLDDRSERVLFAAFDTVSAITSTGFSTYSYEKSGEFISFLLMIVMFFGGMAGSTAGGAKVDRLIVMLKNTRNEFYRVLHLNAVTSVRVDGRAIPHEIVAKVIAFLSIYVLIVVLVAVMLSMMGFPIFDSLFSSMSALSNVGFGYGLTGENSAFALIPDFAKWLLAFEMMVGRLELFTVLVLFTKGFWVKE